MTHLLDNLLIFGRILRGAGFQVHAGRLAEVADALRHVDLGSRDDVYYACRALLVQRRDQIAVFDAAFAAFWLATPRPSAGPAARMMPATESHTGVLEIDTAVPPDIVDGQRESASGRQLDRIEDDDTERDPATAERRVKLWSEADALGQKDFAALTPAEIAAARAALSRLVWQPGARRTRRWIRGKGPRIDLRRAIARSLRSGGEVVELPRRARRERPRPLIVLCDVSGSMERYSRMLLHFAHLLSRRHQRVETFLFSTSLTRVTRQLRRSGPDEALAAVSRVGTGWAGGTKIGAVLKEFHQRWSRRVMHGGAVTLLISDGWDRGEPAELGRQMARLQRSGHRLIWLNPLIGTADYAPLTRGLRAALPFVDDFLPVRTLNNLAQLAIHLNSLPRQSA